VTADDENVDMFQGWSAQDVLDWFERQPHEVHHEMSPALTAASPEAQIAFIRQLRHSPTCRCACHDCNRRVLF
jgi:hypothetical protein